MDSRLELKMEQECNKKLSCMPVLEMLLCLSKFLSQSSIRVRFFLYLVFILCKLDRFNFEYDAVGLTIVL